MGYTLLILLIILIIIGWVSFLTTKLFRKMLSNNEHRQFWNGLIFLVAFSALSFLTFVIYIYNVGFER